MIRDLFTEATEYIAYDITDPKNLFKAGTLYGSKIFKPFKSKKEAIKAFPRDSEDWTVVTKEEYEKLVKEL